MRAWIGCGLLLALAAGGARADGPAVIDAAWPTFQFGDTAFMPMRPIIDWLKAGNSWDAGSGTLHVSLHTGQGRRLLHLTVHSTKAKLNDQDLTLPRAPFLAHGAVYVPARAVLAAMSVNMVWSPEPRGLNLTFEDQQAFLPIMASAFPLVNHDDILLGGRMAGGWAKSEDVAAKLAGGERYWLYTLTEQLPDVVRGAKPKKEDPGEYQNVAIPWPAGISNTAVAFAGPWNAQPRTPRLLKPEGSVYTAAAKEILTAHGLPNATVRLTQAMMVDLDNDGEDEALICATNLSESAVPHEAHVGDYDLVALRRLVGGKVKTQLLAGHFYTDPAKLKVPFVESVQGLLDLDGDNVLEILIGWKYYEGSGTDVYQLQKGEAKLVMSGGAGA